jgi:hypothetical protein
MSKIKRFGKLIVFDCLAILCFIGVVLFGWLPGPGGIPLFLAGLALLAVNHDWAERWLETARHKGKSFKTILFPNVPWIRHLYDILSVVVFSVASYLFFTTRNHIVAAGAIGAVCFSVFVFLVNRQRLDKLLIWAKVTKHKHIK